MPRSKNAKQRRQVLKTIREIKGLLAWLTREWDVEGKVYIPLDSRQPGDNVAWRDRAPEEYPEEQAEAWAHVYNASDEMIKKLTALREQARTRYFELRPEEDK
jgi:hypothetical protein